jgi:Cu/Ag efflux pump CusA
LVLIGLPGIENGRSATHRSPLVVVMIGGSLTSTVLTLIVVSAIFELIGG